MHIRLATYRDLPRIRALLAAAGLPDEDMGAHVPTTLIGVQQGSLVATGALEPLGITGLLRSVAVAPAGRGRGWGRRMTERLIEHAARLGIGDLYLLTTGAAGYFARFGFESCDREAAPAVVRGTRQFADLCPASAVLMRRASDAADLTGLEASS